MLTEPKNELLRFLQQAFFLRFYKASDGLNLTKF